MGCSKQSFFTIIDVTNLINLHIKVWFLYAVKELVNSLCIPYRYTYVEICTCAKKYRPRASISDDAEA